MHTVSPLVSLYRPPGHALHKDEEICRLLTSPYVPVHTACASNKITTTEKAREREDRSQGSVKKIRRQRQEKGKEREEGYGQRSITMGKVVASVEYLMGRHGNTKRMSFRFCLCMIQMGKSVTPSLSITTLGRRGVGYISERSRAPASVVVFTAPRSERENVNSCLLTTITRCAQSLSRLIRVCPWGTYRCVCVQS